jgi:hypothetical protein
MAVLSRTHRLVGGGPVGASAAEAYNGLYKILFRVVIRHAYNNEKHGLCPSFKVMPSPTSMALMQGQGMVFHDDGTGFSVYIHESQIDSFIDYLRRQGQEIDGEIQYWSWLSFVLVQSDPYFIGITSLPIDTNPLHDNLYVSNQNAGQDGNMTPIAGGPAMGASDLVPVTDSQFTVPVTGPLDQVVVRDISGSTVLVVPSDAEIYEIWKTINERDRPSDGEAGAPVGPLQLYVQVDLSTLPLGLYWFSIRVNEAGENGPKIVSETPLERKLYTAARPGPPLVFVDVLFSKPDSSQGGVYPVPPLYENDVIRHDEVGDVVYEMRFDTRQTWWQYYVVSQTPGSALIDLQISGEDATFTRAPDPVLLPSGEVATLFQSDATLAMREIPPQRFALSGIRRDARGKLSRIRIDTLPAAAIAPVWPAPKDKTLPGQPDVNGTSEMYVYV